MQVWMLLRKFSGVQCLFFSDRLNKMISRLLQHLQSHAVFHIRSSGAPVKISMIIRKKHVHFFVFANNRGQAL